METKTGEAIDSWTTRSIDKGCYGHLSFPQNEDGVDFCHGFESLVVQSSSTCISSNNRETIISEDGFGLLMNSRESMNQ